MTDRSDSPSAEELDELASAVLEQADEIASLDAARAEGRDAARHGHGLRDLRQQADRQRPTGRHVDDLRRDIGAHRAVLGLVQQVHREVEQCDGQG